MPTITITHFTFAMKKPYFLQKYKYLQFPARWLMIRSTLSLTTFHTISWCLNQLPLARMIIRHTALKAQLSFVLSARRTANRRKQEINHDKKYD